MKIPKVITTWNKDLSAKQALDLAYWERNMLALAMAVEANLWADECCRPADDSARPGWYYDEDHADDPSWAGWLRVISLNGGEITFHIPDSFDLGNLRKMEKSNWDGHTTEEKWLRIMKAAGCKIEEEQQ